jgi:hypothetical protein
VSGPREADPPEADVPTPGEPAGEAEESAGVASLASLRRTMWVAGAYGLAAGAAYGAATHWRRGLSLTLAAAVSIVALRSLEGVVRHLRVDADGLPSGVPTGVSAAPDGLGWRYPLRIILLTVLIGAVLLGGRDPLGLVLGLSAVPLAIIVEAAVQLVRTARER